MEPRQLMVTPYSLGKYRDYELTARADYSITARILGTRRYPYDRHYHLVPEDVAVGWGRMSDQSVLDQLEISQSFRAFFYHWPRTPPIPPAEIVRHAANMHLIAADDGARRAIARLRTGEVATMTGQLVDAHGPNGYCWPTSLTREDTGPGSCELFYVRSVVLEPPQP